MRTTIPFLIIVLSALAGCGKGGGGAAAAKELFSLWRSDANNAPLDMTGGSFGVTLSYYEIVDVAGAICDCDLVLTGDQGSGVYALSACTYRSGTGGGSDPGCSSGNGTGSYTNAGAVLSICRSSGVCESFH